MDCRAPLEELRALEVWDKHQNCGRVGYTKYLSQEKEGAEILTAGSRNTSIHDLNRSMTRLKITHIDR